MTTRRQRTIQKSSLFSGLGVHTGQSVSLQFNPAPPNHGIVFRRTDLEGKPTIAASVNDVSETLRSTTIGSGQVKIHTVEHVMAALRALEVDNVFVDISNVEPPIANGSSDTFVDMIKEAGIVEQQASLRIGKIKEPIYWSQGDTHLVALPYDGYRISYTLHYPESKAIQAQFYSLDISAESFCREIAPCRTFSKYEEVSALIDRGLIKGGSLDNAVIIKDDVVFSREGLRFPDEMVRHKILDLIGDLALVGIPFEAHVIAIRAGHAANHQLAKKIYESLTREKME